MSPMQQFQQLVEEQNALRGKFNNQMYSLRTMMPAQKATREGLEKIVFKCQTLLNSIN